MPAAELINAYEADLLKSFARSRDDVDLATARQRDGAAQDMRVVGSAIAANIIQADDPTQYAGLNTGARMPITLDQPGVGGAAIK